MQVTLKDVAAIAGVLIGLAGFVWQAAVQVQVNTDQTDRIVKLEKVQTEDHDAITQMKAGIDYLVRKEREKS